MEAIIAELGLTEKDLNEIAIASKLIQLMHIVKDLRSNHEATYNELIRTQNENMYLRKENEQLKHTRNEECNNNILLRSENAWLKSRLDAIGNEYVHKIPKREEDDIGDILAQIANDNPDIPELTPDMINYDIEIKPNKQISNPPDIVAFFNKHNIDVNLCEAPIRYVKKIIESEKWYSDDGFKCPINNNEFMQWISDCDLGIPIPSFRLKQYDVGDYLVWKEKEKPKPIAAKV
jgi:predicted nuclease with TOPRIM domain